MAIWVNSFTLKDTTHLFAKIHVCLLYAGLHFALVAFLINFTDIFSSCNDERPKKLYDTRFDILSALLWYDVELKGMNKLCSLII